MAHKVLIVDDEPSIRLTLAEFLRREGFEPITAADAAQGAALFGEGVEVAVVDINLPGRSGIELLRELRERDPSVPIIVITGEPNVSHLPEIVRGGAYDFLPKPVLKESITRAVARAAEKKRLDDERRRLEEEVKRHTEELEQRVAERTADLAAAHSFLNLVLDSSTEYAIVALDLEYRITLFNRGAELLFGYTPAQTTGRRPRELFLDVERYGENVLVECLKEADAVGLYQTEMILHRLDGEEFPAAVALTPIVGGDLTLGHLCVMRDLTAERRAEESLRQMQARLAHQEKIVELGRVAAQVAHEVRNPLTGLQLYCMHMKSKLADRMSGAELQLADKIIETINHLSQTVEQIVSFARPLSLERRAVDLNHIVTDLLQLLAPQLDSAHVEPYVELSAEPMRGRLDESSLRSALTNLILNAVQAMNGGGRLSIKTLRNDDGLRVEIADTGAGMTREQVGRVFEAFYTTKAKGLGLGMPYAKKVIEEHGGEIGVESSPGEGTLVTVRLPAQAEDA
ncbi:MAG: two-component system, NtrC family, sensor histidine kinase AtoS [Acidobacteriota bacterium]|jgi:PAS domain S-box-containing protein|nr:two-component system, NtrC family, sensor histidine kinase AtoS [Acidobacteriota bacterium]